LSQINIKEVIVEEKTKKLRKKKKERMKDKQKQNPLASPSRFETQIVHFAPKPHSKK